MSDARLATIRSLLAKAEATNFPAEADAFNAKAAELMARYAIDHAMIAEASGAEDPLDELVINLHPPYLAPQAVLVCEVAQHSNCMAVRYVGVGQDGTEQVRIVGHRSDLDLVDTLVTSLLVQLRGAMVRDTPTGGTAAQTASWRRSFISGFVDAVGQRLASRRAAAMAEAQAEHSGPGPSVAVVLADRSASVHAEFRRRHPRVRVSRVGVGSSAAGRRSGHHAGSNADLGGTRLRARGALARP